MKIILTLFLNIILFTSFAQYSPVLKGKVSFSRFLKSTTFVVLGEDEEVNSVLMESFKSTWTITPIQFIYEAEFPAYVNDPEKSFIYLKDFKVKEERKDVGALAVFNGGYNDIEFYLNSSLAYIAYDNWGVEKKANDLLYRLPAMVYQLQSTINLIYDNNLEVKNTESLVLKLNKLYNARAGQMQNKTLLIDKLYETHKIISIKEFAKKYGYAFEIVGGEEIKEAIQSKAKDKAVLVSSYNLYKINQVFDCATYDIIYAELEKNVLYEERQLDKFDLEDAEQLATAVKKGK